MNNMENITNNIIGDFYYEKTCFDIGGDLHHYLVNS